MSELKKSPAWEDLTFANNFLFCKILENDPELCRQILEMLLDIEIEKLEPVQAERTMLETMDSKSVRFDVYAKDGNRIFDSEIKLNDRAYKVFYIASEDAENFLREGDLPEKVARCIGLPLEKVQEIAERLCIKA